MKKYKQIDLLVNVALIAGFTLCTLLRGGETIFIAYFVVGGWQVISMIVHIACRWFTNKGSARYNYNWVSFLSLISFPVGSFWILLFTAPFMAIYYTYQCYYEVFVKMQRPLAMLK